MEFTIDHSPQKNIFRNTKNYIVSLNNVNKKPMTYFDLESNFKTSSVANNDIPIYVLPSITFEIQNFYSDLGPEKVFNFLLYFLTNFHDQRLRQRVTVLFH